MKKTLSTILLSTTLLILSGCQSADTAENPENSQTTENETQEPQTDTQAREVETFTVSETTETTTSPDAPRVNNTKIGQVDSAQKVTIKSEVNGKIASINFTEGEQIDQDVTIATLGSSLNADIQDLNFQNSLISLKNAEEQLESKKRANQQSIENTKLSIDQAAIQLETARNSAQNITRTTDTNIYHLIENDPRWYTEQDTTSYSNQYSYNNSYNRYYDYYGSENDYDYNYYDTNRTAIKKSAEETTQATDTTTQDTSNPMQDIDAQVRQIRQNIEKAQDSYYTQMNSAISQIQLAEIQLENAKQLFELKKTQVQLEEQSLIDQIEQLSGQVAIADRNRQTREIKSPIKGTFLKKLVEEGEMVNPGQAIAEIGKIGIIKVNVTVTQQEASKYQELQPVTIITPDKKALPGIITKLPFTYNEQTKTGTLEIELENPDQILKPGMTVEVNFATPKTDSEKPNDNEKGIWIPLNATYFRTDTYVFTIEDGKAVKNFIETGEINNGMIQVTKGLKIGDTIITERHNIEEDLAVTAK